MRRSLLPPGLPEPLRVLDARSQARGSPSCILLSFWDVSPFHPSEDPKLLSRPNACHMSRTGLSFWAFLRSPPTSMPIVLPWATHQLRLCPGDIVSISGCSNSASPSPRGVVSCSLLVPLLKGEGDTFRAERTPRSHLNQLQHLHL